MGANLAKISNLPWVVEQCLSRTATSADNQKALLDFGLQLSEAQATGEAPSLAGAACASAVCSCLHSCCRHPWSVRVMFSSAKPGSIPAVMLLHCVGLLTWPAVQRPPVVAGAADALAAACQSTPLMLHRKVQASGSQTRQPEGRRRQGHREDLADCQCGWCSMCACCSMLASTQSACRYCRGTQRGQPKGCRGQGHRGGLGRPPVVAGAARALAAASRAAGHLAAPLQRVRPGLAENM